jgi:CubicO group peptidase (beta-lactamase class C family)
MHLKFSRMKKLYAFICLLFLFVYGWAQDITKRLDTYLSKPGVFNGAALVVYKGNVILNKGYGYKDKQKGLLNDSMTIFRIGSLSKPFTAIVVLHLEEKGLLRVQDKLSKFLPDYPGGDSITIEQLLIHRSGVKEYLAVKAVQQLPDTFPPISMEQLIGYFKNEPRFLDPKDKLNYSNSNYILLAAIIEKVTGEKFEHVVRRLIFEPMHMEHSGFDFSHLKTTDKATGHRNKEMVPVVDFDSTGAPGCGSMYSTVSDLYKWYKGLYAGVLIRDSTRERAFVQRNWLYGYGWFRQTIYDRKCIFHPGGVPGFVADFAFYPEEDLCIVLLNNRDRGKATAERVAGMVFGQRYEKGEFQ